MLWALMPQLACFFPEEMLTESESECCRQMASDCDEANMPQHDCCRTLVQPNVATSAKALRDLNPHFEVLATVIAFETPSLPLFDDVAAGSVRNIHAPPDDSYALSLVLRI
jgi:hypothetical protein